MMNYVYVNEDLLCMYILPKYLKRATASVVVILS